MRPHLLLANLALLGATLVQACDWNKDSLNKCPFMPCRYDFECSTSSCTLQDNGISDDGYGICKPPGWLLAIIIIVAILILAGFITCIVCCCCCCCRRRRVDNEVHVYNHLIDQNGNPYVVKKIEGKQSKKKAGK